jgi:NAD(P) transhydrogenase
MDVDLLVIGTGPAGQRGAVQAAKLGKRVAIVERREVVGGVCINTGTIPSKTLREAVLYLSGFAQRGIYGQAYTVKQDITAQDLLFRTQRVIEKEIDVVRAQMGRNGVDVIPGTASFLDSHTIRVESTKEVKEIQADKILVAVGTKPSLPPGVSPDGDIVLDSDQILHLKKIPRTLTVVGAGVIGLEYGSMFAALGTKVTLVDKRPRLLEFLDTEIVDDLVYQLRNMGTVTRLGEDVKEIHISPEGRAVATMQSGKVIVSDMLLYSAGRVGATADLNLELAGLSADSRGRLAVNAEYQTEVPNIYAAGDVIGFPSLASTGSEQGRLAACHAFGIETRSIPALFPYGIYSIPEISYVGRNEDELTTANVPYEVGIARYKEIARGQILGDDSGLLKLLFHRETRKLLGVHAIGTQATELIHVGQAVMAFDGTIDYFVNNVFNYPTLAECYKVAALDGMNKIGWSPNGTLAAEAPKALGDAVRGLSG